MEIPLRCECGTVTGVVTVRGPAVHGACYCRDCQAFARYLGRPGRMLDAAAGTEVIGTQPSRIRFTAGQDRLACITLTGRGPYRWYADCCRMAIGNGSRSPKVPFITVQCRALAASPDELERAFGPRTFAFGVKAAATQVAGTPLGLALAVPKILWSILAARLGGSWRSNPFFKPGTSEPIRAPQALSPQQRHELRGDALHPPGG